MKRDMDLIRQILLRLEKEDVPPGGMKPVDPYEIPPYSRRDVQEHFAMLAASSLLDLQQPLGSKTFLTAGGNILFRQLTWEGRDFVDAIRDDDVWEKTKNGALAAGGFTFDLLKDLAKGFLKKKITELSGVEL